MNHQPELPGNDAEIPADRKLIKTMKKKHPKRLKNDAVISWPTAVMTIRN